MLKLLPSTSLTNNRFSFKLIGLLVSTILFFSSLNAYAQSPENKGILVFTKTNGFRHNSIDDGVALLNEIGTTYNIPVTNTEDGAMFNADTLQNYNVVVFCNTSGDGLLTVEQQAAMEAFIQAGNGFVGIHAATDTYRDGSWPWYNDLVGGIVQTSPNHTAANYAGTMDVNEADNAITNHLGNTWEKIEEYYYWELNGGYLFDGNIDLLTVRSTGSESYDAPRPVTWYKNYDGGRSFYTALGHNDADYTNDADFRKLIENGVLWAANRLQIETIPPSFALTSPANGSVFTENGTVTFTIESSEPVDSLQSVSYFANDTLISEITTGDLLTFNWVTPPPAAAYNIFAEVALNNDSIYYTDTIGITVEASNIALSITSPTNNSTFLNGEDVAISLAADTGIFTIDSIGYFVNETTQLAVLNGEDKLNYLWETPNPGSYNLHAAMWLNNGDTIFSDTIALTIEAFLPSLSITGPLSGSTYSEIEDVSINLAADTGIFTIDSIGYFVNDTTQLAVLNGEEKLNYIWETPNPGSYNLHAAMWLNNGDTIFSDTIALTIEAFLPSLSLTEPLNGSTFSEIEDVAIDLVADTGIFTIDSIGYFVNDTVQLAMLNNAQKLNYLWEKPNPGNYNLHTAMWLNNGDTVFSDTIQLTIENFQSNLNILTPENNAVFTNAEDIDIQLEADSGIYFIDSIAYILNDTTQLAVLDSADKLNYLWALPNSGSYTLHSSMWLNNGDTVYSDTINLTILPFVPTLSITTPQSNTVFTDAEDIAISLLADTGRFTIDSIAYVLNDTLQLALLDSAETEYLWTFPDTGAFTLHSSMWLNNGDTIYSDTINLTVLPFVPSLSIESPLDNTIFTDADDIGISLLADTGRFTIDSIAYVLNDTLQLALLDSAETEYLWTFPDTGAFTLHSSMWLNNGDTVYSDTINLSVIPFKPSLQIIAPADSSIFTNNDNIEISYLANAGRDSIDQIVFYADSIIIGELNAEPFENFTWVDPDTGQYNLSAVMFIASEDTIYSDTVFTAVIPFSAEVAVTSPASSSSFEAPAEILIQTEISISEDLIDKVVFYQGNFEIGSDSLAPYQYSWSNVPAGEYSLRAEVTKIDGSMISSGNVEVTVTSPGNFKQYRLEAEDFMLSNYQIESGSFASAGRYIGILNGETGTVGEAKIAFEGPADTYSVSIGYFDESDGISQATFFLNDQEIETWLFDDETGETVANSNAFRKITFATPLELNVGDTIRLRGTRTSFAFARLDYVEIQSVTTLNNLPEVSITNPTNNSSFENGSDIIVSAEATDADGEITRVEFYENSQLLSIDTEAPYSYNWANVQTGNYAITAIAYDEASGQTTSEPINIAVNQPTGECTTLYEEQDGLLVIEAESAETTANWQERTLINGYTGPSYMVWQGEDFFAEPGDEVLTYNFKINNPGTYRFVWRSYSTIGNVVSENNDSWLRVQGVRMFAIDEGDIVYPEGGFGIPAGGTTVPGSTNGWFKVYMGEVDKWSLQANTFDNNPHDIFMEFTEAGDYTFEVAGRSTGHAIDRIILFKEPVSFAQATDTNQEETLCDGAIINEKPNVRITSPQNSATFPAGANITITADAFDNDGSIANVAFFAGNNLLGEVANAPYTFAWTNVPDGTYFLTAVATDDLGETVTSSAIAIRVGDNIQNKAPTGNIISPIDGTRFDIGTSFTIQSLASDEDGSIDRVEFFYNGQLLNIDRTAPYRFDWETTIAGRYDISAKIIDNLEESFFTDTIAIFVNAIPGNLPPTVSITAPQDNAFFEANTPITITANANDPDGSVRSVEFFVGGLRVGTDNNAPYSVTLNNPEQGAQSVFARAIDNQGAVSNSSLISIIIGEDVSENPAVVITAPASDTTIASAGSVTVRVATDPDLDINSVSFFLDGVNLVEDDRPPFSFTLSFPFDGVYKLRVRAFDNLGNTYVSKELTITVGDSGPNSLDKLSAEAIGFGVAPNPVKYEAFIYHQLPVNTTYELALVDLMGRKFFTTKATKSNIGESSFKIDVTQLPTGIYLVFLKTADGVYVKKLRKQ